MKKLIVFGFLNLLLITVFSQKDSEAWKAEKNLESQFKVLKENSSTWNGHVMIKEPKLNTFHKSILDTITGLEKTIVDVNAQIAKSKEEVTVLSKKVAETQTNLDASLLRENELVTLGVSYDKNVFPKVAYTIIVLVVLIGLVLFIMFFRSNAVTRETNKRNEELQAKIQTQKEKSLERETKLARELQTERNKNNA